MRKSRFSDDQILAILHQRDLGRSVAELCAQHGVSEATLYAWRTKFRLHSPIRDEYVERLEQENERLRRLIFDLTAEQQKLKGDACHPHWPHNPTDLATQA